MVSAGLCKAAKEEHARDLPIMNGIKEIIKSIEVLESSSPKYRDVLYTLSARLKSLQVFKPNLLELIIILLLSFEFSFFSFRSYIYKC